MVDISTGDRPGASGQSAEPRCRSHAKAEPLGARARRCTRSGGRRWTSIRTVRSRCSTRAIDLVGPARPNGASPHSLAHAAASTAERSEAGSIAQAHEALGVRTGDRVAAHVDGGAGLRRRRARRSRSCRGGSGRGRLPRPAVDQSMSIPSQGPDASDANVRETVARAALGDAGYERQPHVGRR